MTGNRKGVDIGIAPLRKRQSLADEIVDVLVARMDSGDLKPGDQLPTEHQLAEAFGVSRSVVRESMARLKHDGLIESQQGRGAFVVDAALTTPSHAKKAEGGNSPSDVAALRIAVEPTAARLAAIHATDAQIAAIATAVAALEQAKTLPNGGADADMQFHQAVARASGNPLFVSVIDLVAADMKAALDLSHGNTRKVTGGTSAVQVEHQAIHDAIAARDGDKAFKAMEQHLLRSAARLSLTIPAAPARRG